MRWSVLSLETARPVDLMDMSSWSLHGRESIVKLTAHGVQVVAPHGLVLNVTYHGLRRIQLDIEQNRPATFVFVPHDPQDQPQVVSIRPTSTKLRAKQSPSSETVWRDWTARLTGRPSRRPFCRDPFLAGCPNRPSLATGPARMQTD